MLTVLQTNTALHLVAASSVAQTLKAHPIPRRWTTVSATSTISVQTAMHQRELLAVRYAPAIRAAGSEGRQLTTAPAKSITTALMGTEKKEKDARFALFIPPAPRMDPRSLTASVTSITLLQTGMQRQTSVAKSALPNHTALGPIPRWKIARVMLTVGPVQATLQKATLAWQNAIRSRNKAVVV